MDERPAPRHAWIGAILLAVVASVPLPGLVNASADPLEFFTRMVDTSGARGMEPVASFGPDGRVYYSGMDDLANDGHLWSAPGSTGDFASEGNPPTTGGTDAVVFVPSSGAVYFAEVGGSQTGTGWRVGGTWSTYTFDPGPDRPWFGEKAGETYLAAAATSIDLRKKTDSANSWTFVDAVVSNAGLAKYRLVAGTHYVLYFASQDSRWYVRYGDVGSWTTTAALPQIDSAVNVEKFGLPGLAIDEQNNIYASWGEKRGNTLGIWLSRWTGSQWTQPFLVSTGIGNAAFHGIASKGVGRLGVAYYETNQRGYPDEVTSDASWDLNYTLVVGANGQPSVDSRTTLRVKGHTGTLTKHKVGDFIWVEPIPGSTRGWVVVAFGCTTYVPAGCKPQGAAQGAFPAFTDQRGGPGLIS